MVCCNKDNILIVFIMILYKRFYNAEVNMKWINHQFLSYWSDFFRLLTYFVPVAHKDISVDILLTQCHLTKWFFLQIIMWYLNPYCNKWVLNKGKGNRNCIVFKTKHQLDSSTLVTWAIKKKWFVVSKYVKILDSFINNHSPHTT